MKVFFRPSGCISRHRAESAWPFTTAVLALLTGGALVAEELTPSARTTAVARSNAAVRVSATNTLPVLPVSFTRERVLKNGKSCRVTFHGQAFTTNTLEKLERVEITMADRVVYVPSEMILNLDRIDLQEGIQVAELGDDLYLVFTGGAAGLKWRQKLLITGLRVAETEFTPDNRTGAASVITRYPPPPEIRTFPMPISRLVTSVIAAQSGTNAISRQGIPAAEIPVDNK